LFARVSTYEVPDGQRGAAQDAFKQAMDRIAALQGFVEGYFLLACDGERAMTMTFWESNAAMTASRVAATRLRSEAARGIESEIISVEEYEVVVHASSPLPSTPA
jgi:heme-degrading monooxygenase HmoA